MWGEVNMVNNYMENYELEKKGQRAKNFSKYKDILIELFKEEDFIKFCKMLDDNKHKAGFESAIIFLYINMRDNYVFKEGFMKNYSQYMAENLTEYYNNEFCHYLLGGDQENLYNKNEYYENEAFGKSVKQLLESARKESIELIMKLKKTNELSSAEKTLFENIILFLSKFSAISTKIVREYFDKYPIISFESVRDKKLKLIDLLSKKSEEMGTVMGLYMRECPDSDEEYSAHGFHLTSEKTGLEQVILYDITDHEIKEDVKYFEKIYVTYHELGHTNQVINLSKYSEIDQKRFEMEKYLVANDKDFYHENHDNFLLEQDAVRFALNEMIKDFGNNKIAMEICEFYAHKLKQVQENDKLFFSILIERYEKVKNGTLDEKPENKHL